VGARACICAGGEDGCGGGRGAVRCRCL